MYASLAPKVVSPCCTGMNRKFECRCLPAHLTSMSVQKKAAGDISVVNKLVPVHVPLTNSYGQTAECCRSYVFDTSSHLRPHVEQNCTSTKPLASKSSFAPNICWPSSQKYSGGSASRRLGGNGGRISMRCAGKTPTLSFRYASRTRRPTIKSGKAPQPKTSGHFFAPLSSSRTTANSPTGRSDAMLHSGQDANRSRPRAMSWTQGNPRF